MKKKVKTEAQKQIEKAYRNNRKRIQSYIREAKKYGVTVPTDILPDKPKKVTEASVRRLAKITKRQFGELLAKKGAYRTKNGEMFKDYLDYRKFIKEQKEIVSLTLDVYNVIYKRIGGFTYSEILLGGLKKAAFYHEQHDDVIYLQDIMEQHEEDPNYRPYLRQHESEITEQLDKWELQFMYEEAYRYTVAILATLLNMGTTQGLDLEKINEFQEYFDTRFGEVEK